MYEALEKSLWDILPWEHWRTVLQIADHAYEICLYAGRCYQTGNDDESQV